MSAPGVALAGLAAAGWLAAGYAYLEWRRTTDLVLDLGEQLACDVHA